MPYPAKSVVANTADELDRFAAEHAGTSISDCGDDVSQVNTLSASRAAGPLAVFMRWSGNVPEDAIGDLIANLLHLSDALGLDSGDVLGSAERRYREELEEVW